MNTNVQTVKNNLELSKNLPLKTALYQAFKKTIILREIPAGTRINEKEFSSELNISRTPIRHALTLLEEENLVEHIPNRGIIVRGISLADAIEIFEIRKALETLATIKAMKRMSAQDFEELRRHLEACQALVTGDRLDLVLDNFNQFNHLIFEKSQMLRLRDMVNELQTYLAYFRKISISSKERCRLALEEHWLIYRGMLNQDEGQVQLLTHEHLDNSLAYILQALDKEGIS